MGRVLCGRISPFFNGTVIMRSGWEPCRQGTVEQWNKCFFSIFLSFGAFVIRQRAPFFFWVCQLFAMWTSDFIFLLSFHFKPTSFCDDSTRHAGGLHILFQSSHENNGRYTFISQIFFCQISLSLAVAVIGFFGLRGRTFTCLFFNIYFFSFVWVASKHLVLCVCVCVKQFFLLSY